MDTAEHSTPVPTTPVPAVTELQPYRVEAAARLLREQDLGRATIPIGEYVRLFQAPEPGKGAFVGYFWHTLEEMDQCLTPLCAFFGEKLPRAISSDELAEYVAQRGSIGVTPKAILQELSCLDAVVRLLRCKHSFSLPSRKFLKPAPPAGKEPSEGPPPAARREPEDLSLPNWRTDSGRAELQAKVIALAQAGLARREIAAQLKVHWTVVHRRLREAGITPVDLARAYKATMTERDVVTIREERRRGVTTGELARRYGVHGHTIARCVYGDTFGHVPGALSRAEVRAKRNAAGAARKRKG